MASIGTFIPVLSQRSSLLKAQMFSFARPILSKTRDGSETGSLSQYAVVLFITVQALDRDCPLRNHCLPFWAFVAHAPKRIGPLTKCGRGLMLEVPSTQIYRYRYRAYQAQSSIDGCNNFDSIRLPLHPMTKLKTNLQVHEIASNAQIKSQH